MSMSISIYTWTTARRSAKSTLISCDEERVYLCVYI